MGCCNARHGFVCELLRLKRSIFEVRNRFDRPYTTLKHEKRVHNQQQSAILSVSASDTLKLKLSGPEV